MDKKRSALTILLIMATLFTSAVTANEDKLPAFLSGDNTELKRCSRGELKAFHLFHVGYAALYMEQCRQINNIFGQSAKRIRFLYAREIPARAFREAAEEYLQINLGKKYESWKAPINQFNRGYRDINDGDYYDLIYTPDTGLKLYLNDSFLAELENPAIGLAYLKIWFGNEPFSASLKKSSLTSEN